MLNADKSPDVGKFLGMPTDQYIDIARPATDYNWQNTTGHNGYMYLNVHHTSASDARASLAISPNTMSSLNDAVMSIAQIESTNDRTTAIYIPVPKNWYCRIGYYNVSTSATLFKLRFIYAD